MNKFIIALVFIMTACGDRDKVQLIPGPQGEMGKNGNDGAIGPVGPEGPQGIPGLNGTTFSVVQLCPTIPGAFPEVLFKIGSSLYALFDGGPHSDRLVLLPDGNYQTTDGRNCVFTVSGGNVL